MRCQTLSKNDGHTWYAFGQDPGKHDKIIDTNQIVLNSGGETVLLDPSTASFVTAYCPAGKVVTGGGYRNAIGGVISSSPLNTEGWMVQFDTRGFTCGAPGCRAVPVTVIAICAEGENIIVGPPPSGGGF